MTCSNVNTFWLVAILFGCWVNTLHIWSVRPCTHFLQHREFKLNSGEDFCNQKDGWSSGDYTGWKDGLHGAIVTAIHFSQLMGCMGSIVVAIVTCEQSRWILYNPFVVIKIVVAIVPREQSFTEQKKIVSDVIKSRKGNNKCQHFQEIEIMS